MKRSKFGRLNLRDIIHGVLMTVIGTVGTGVITSLNAGHLPIGAEFQPLLMMGAASGGTYILKQVFTNEEGNIGGDKISQE